MNKSSYAEHCNKIITIYLPNNEKTDKIQLSHILIYALNGKNLQICSVEKICKHLESVTKLVINHSRNIKNF